jgi:phosphoribosylanthranilate isomerase
MWTLPVFKVGIFVGEVPDTWELDVAQIYGDAGPGTSLRQVRVWRGIKPNAERTGAEAYVLDLSEGTGKTFDWSLAAGLPELIVLAGGLDGGNVRTAIAAARPWGVDACSRLESSPGEKDPAKVRAFVTAAKEAFAEWE